VATAHTTIASIYRNQSQFDHAITASRKALAIQLKQLGPDHADVGTTYTSLGLMFHELGKHKKSLDYYKKALLITIKAHGSTHPTVAGVYSNIGTVLAEQGRFDQAITQALSIHEAAVGACHPDFATTLTLMGGVHSSAGNVKPALECFDKALAIRADKLGGDHPATKEVRARLVLLRGEEAAMRVAQA
jgi:Tfp pilus assembly protein PilF